MRESRFTKTAIAAGCLSLLAALQPAVATNITISDTVSGSGSWYGTSEIHEVELGTTGSHAWDLEAFTLSGNRLSLIGGYNFKNGYWGTTGGHLFVDVTDDALYGSAAAGLVPSGSGYRSMLNPFGYDYAFVFNFANNTYNLYSLTASSPLLTAYYSGNNGSSPWTYNWQNDANRNLVGTGSITYQYGLSSSSVNSQYGVDASASGSTHNVISLDLPALFAGDDIFVHYTMSCGNDNIVGQAHVPEIPQTPPPNNVPDAGATGLLFSLSLGTLGLLRRARTAVC